MYGKHWSKRKWRLTCPPLSDANRELTSELSYLLGVLKGDGHLQFDTKNGNYVFDLRVKDLDFIEETHRCMVQQFGDENISLYGEDGSGCHRVVLRRKRVVEFLRNNMDDLLVGVAQGNVKASFLRGFYDSDGCAYLRKDGGKLIVLSNTDKHLLSFAKGLLDDLGIWSGNLCLTTKAGSERRIGGKRIVSTKDCYSLNIARKESIRRFRAVVGFSIQRKMDIMAGV